MLKISVISAFFMSEQKAWPREKENLCFQFQKRSRENGYVYDGTLPLTSPSKLKHYWESGVEGALLTQRSCFFSETFRFSQKLHVTEVNINSAAVDETSFPSIMPTSNGFSLHG